MSTLSKEQGFYSSQFAKVPDEDELSPMGKLAEAVAGDAKASAIVTNMVAKGVKMNADSRNSPYFPSMADAVAFSAQVNKKDGPSL